MATAATPQEMNRFVQSVDEFFAKYAKLISPSMRAEVYASGNSTLIREYEATVSRARALKVTIEATTGAWAAAKSAWRSVTDTTSTVIGDAIDEIRSWFGYQPGGGVGAYSVSPISGGALGQWRGGGTLGALGAVQVPMAAWVAGILGAVYLASAAMDKIFISVQATRIQKDDPTVSRTDALDAASRAVKTAGLFGGATLPLIAAAALAAFLLLGKKS
jgi:hypothetical protein